VDNICESVCIDKAAGDLLGLAIITIGRHDKSLCKYCSLLCHWKNWYMISSCDHVESRDMATLYPEAFAERNLQARSERGPLIL
jgi:hypothetical protein